MNITRNNIDDLNAVLSVTIDKVDFAEQVDKTLASLRKNANIKGFRKGQVPLSFIKKQYEQSLIFDEVNKLLQNSLNNYIDQEKLSILGNPLPKNQEDIDWYSETFNFEFELGLAPEFDVDLKKVEATNYKVVVDDKELEKYISNFASRYGSLKTLDAVEKEANIKADIVELNADDSEKEDGINKNVFIRTEDLKDFKTLKGKKVGDSVEVEAQKLFAKEEDLAYVLGVSEDEAKEVNKLKLTITEVNKVESAAIDQALFDKVYGEGAVDSEEAFKNKIKEEAEKMYAAETDRQLLNDTVEALVENTKFDLPNEFLVKWLQFSNSSIANAEQAKSEYEKMQNGLRYQLIESKIAADNEVNVTAEEVQEAAREAIKQQLLAYGQNNIPDEYLENFVQSTLSNQEEANKLSYEVFGKKILNILKENIQLNDKEVTFDEFVEVVNQRREALEAKNAAQEA